MFTIFPYHLNAANAERIFLMPPLGLNLRAFDERTRHKTHDHQVCRHWRELIEGTELDFMDGLDVVMEQIAQRLQGKEVRGSEQVPTGLLFELVIQSVKGIQEIEQCVGIRLLKLVDVGSEKPIDRCVQ